MTVPRSDAHLATVPAGDCGLGSLVDRTRGRKLGGRHSAAPELPVTPPGGILRRRRTAAYLGVSLETLRKIRINDSSFPDEVQITEVAIGWRKSELDAWLDSRKKRHAAAVSAEGAAR